MVLPVNNHEGLRMNVFSRIAVFMEMIKFSHTIFALPFALTGALLAARGIPTPAQLFWIVMAMVGGRTAAMGLNRVIDAEIDARNPRTSGRAIPAGLLGKGTVAVFIVISVLLMCYAAARLNPLCLWLSPVALFFLVLYSYCKRFTALAHLVLGLCLGAAPVGAWVAIRGTIDLPVVLLGETASGIERPEELVPKVAAVPGVLGVAAFTYVKAMVFHEGLTEGMVVKGVDLRSERGVTTVGRNIQRGLGTHYQKAQAAMEAELDRSTIADVLKEVLKTSK